MNGAHTARSSTRALAAILGIACTSAWGDSPDARARIVCTREITGGGLPVDGGVIPVGGISDLYLEREAVGGTCRLWAVTDRGPNGLVTVEERGREEQRRTMLAPEFVPSLVLLDATWIGDGADQQRTGSVNVEKIVPLKGRSGRGLSGRSNGLGHDERGYRPDGSAALAPDPDGVDTEGLVAAGDGGFWLVEEYRPSILRVAADGTVMSRHVPAGDDLPGAEATVAANLPRRYAGRAKNRGFEAVAITPDRRRIFALLQSPLERRPEGGEPHVGVPLLAFDAIAGRPIAEHEYPLDDPAADPKLCAMACLGNDSLLVLEQAEGGVARLYRIDLPAEPRGSAVRKTLVADLAPLVPTMLVDVHGEGGAKNRPLKIEGLAIVSERRVLLANDNDFGVADAGKKGTSSPHSCLWLIELSEPLVLDPQT